MSLKHPSKKQVPKMMLISWRWPQAGGCLRIQRPRLLPPLCPGLLCDEKTVLQMDFLSILYDGTKKMQASQASPSLWEANGRESGPLSSDLAENCHLVCHWLPPCCQRRKRRNTLPIALQLPREVVQQALFKPPSSSGSDGAF